MELSLNKQVIINLVLKGATILINLLIVPISITYLSIENYGLLITFTSFLSIATVLDFGLGDNLRLTVSKELFEENTKNIKTLIGTTYALIFLVGISVMLLFFFIEFFFGWSVILNIEHKHESIRPFILLASSAFVLKITLNLIHRIFLGFRRTLLSSTLNLSISLGSLLLLYFLLQYRASSLVDYVVYIWGVEIIIVILFSIFFFKTKLKPFIPSFKHIKLKKKGLFSSNIFYFLIAVSAFLVTASDNFMISHLLSPSEVSTYHVALKLFGFPSLIFLTARLPIFSHYLNHYLKKDFEWFKQVTKKILRMWLGLTLLVFVILAFSDGIVAFWFKNQLSIPFNVSLLMAIYFILDMYKSIYALFLSGIGEIKKLAANVVLAAVLNIPLSILFAYYFNWGLSGIIMGTLLSRIPEVISTPIQYRKLILKNRV